jgi:hypothetical protein
MDDSDSVANREFRIVWQQLGVNEIADFAGGPNPPFKDRNQGVGASIVVIIF